MKNKTVPTPQEQTTIDRLPNLGIAGIATIIDANWPKVYFGARPYLDAMYQLNSITDNYFADSGKSVVLYFLCNARTWTGCIAKACKAELNRRVKNASK